MLQRATALAHQILAEAGTGGGAPSVAGAVPRDKAAAAEDPQPDTSQLAVTLPEMYKWIQRRLRLDPATVTDDRARRVVLCEHIPLITSGDALLSLLEK